MIVTGLHIGQAEAGIIRAQVTWFSLLRIPFIDEDRANSISKSYGDEIKWQSKGGRLWTSDYCLNAKDDRSAQAHETEQRAGE